MRGTQGRVRNETKQTYGMARNIGDAISYTGFRVCVFCRRRHLSCGLQRLWLLYYGNIFFRNAGNRLLLSLSKCNRPETLSSPLSGSCSTDVCMQRVPYIYMKAMALAGSEQALMV